jgi:hypothetical protein
MKKLLTFSLVTAFSLSANVMAAPKYTGELDVSCEIEVKGNKSEYSAFKNISDSKSFVIPSSGRNSRALRFKLIRLYPEYFLSQDDLSNTEINKASHDKNQVVMMLRNSDEVLRQAVEEDDFVKPNSEFDYIKNRLHVTIENYTPEDGNFRVDVATTAGTLKTTNFKFPKSGEMKVKVVAPVHFNYKDYKLKGFLGIPSLFEDGNDKYESKSEEKRHKSKVVLECKVKKVKSGEQEEVAAPTEEVQENTERSSRRVRIES